MPAGWRVKQWVNAVPCRPAGTNKKRSWRTYKEQAGKVQHAPGPQPCYSCIATSGTWL